jgi:hypothetical protein
VIEDAPAGYQSITNIKKVLAIFKTHPLAQM